MLYIFREPCQYRTFPETEPQSDHRFGRTLYLSGRYLEPGLQTLENTMRNHGLNRPQTGQRVQCHFLALPATVRRLGKRSENSISEILDVGWYPSYGCRTQKNGRYVDQSCRRKIVIGTSPNKLNHSLTSINTFQLLPNPNQP